MLPDRSSAAAFPIGAAVEVRSNDAGFNGSWYEATVVQLRTKLRACDVEYVTLVTNDDPSRPLRETVLTRHVRPRGLRLAAGAVYAVDDLVYAFHNDGWWPGVVSAMHGGDPPERYTVSFPNSREVVDCAPSEIRPRMEWKQGRWFPLENKSECQFKMGDNVEVSGDKENYGAVWFNGTVVKVIAKTILLVEYTRCKGDGSQEVLREFLDTQYVRPVPLSKPVGKRLRHQSKHFALAEELEVYHCGGWMLGVVSRIVDNSRYIVKLRHGKEEEIDAGHYEMRKLSNWTNGKWVYPTKNHGRPSRGRPTHAGKKCDMPYSISSSSSTDVAQPKTTSLKRKLREESNSEGQTETQLPNKEPRKTDPSAMEIDPKTPAVYKEAHASKQDFESPPCDVDIGSLYVEAGLIEKLDEQNFPKGDSIAEVIVQGEDASKSAIKVSTTQSSNHSLSTHETGFCVRQTDWGDFNSVRNPWTSVPMRRKKLAIRPRQDAHDAKHSSVDTPKKIAEPLKVSTENTVSTSVAGTGKQQPKGSGDQVVEGKESVTDKLSDQDKVIMCENSPSSVASKDNDVSNTDPNEPVCILAAQQFTPRAHDNNTSVSFSTETLQKIPSTTNGCNGSTVEIKAPPHPLMENLAIARSISSDPQVKEASTLSITSLPLGCYDATDRNDTSTSFVTKTLPRTPSSANGCDGMTTDDGMKNPPHPVKDDCAISRVEGTVILDKAADEALPFKGNGATEKNHGPSERLSVDEIVLTNQVPILSSLALPFEGNGATDMNGNGATDTNGNGDGATDTNGNGATKKNHGPSEGPSVDEMVLANQAPDLPSLAVPFEGNGVTEKSRGPSERPSVDEIVFTNQAPVQSSLAHQFDGNGVNPGPSERPSENEIVLTNQVPGSSSLARALPFDKSSFLWESIESMEIFRRLPQEPHFGALEQQYPREFREGMAIGMMTTFAKLEADIRELDAFHSREVFEDKTKALKYLEENGFTVQILQSRIDDLLELRNSLSEIQNKEITLKEQAQEKEHERAEIHTLKYIVDKTIKEREQQLALLCEKRDALVAREMKKDSELADLRKDVDAMEEAYLAALERFRTVSAAPW